MGDTAVLIKVSQNVLIAFVCLTLAVIYHDMVQYEKNHKKQLLEKKQKKRYETMTDETDDIDVQASDMNKCAFLWKKFPKFIIGYLGLSIVISALIIPLSLDGYAQRFVNNIGQISRWLFTLGFVGIGAKTKFTTLWESIKDGKYLKIYLVGQTVDTILTFIAAFIVFT